MCNSPYHELAKWLASLLQPIREKLCLHSLRDTFEFVAAIQDMEVDNRKMCSFDVSSLFTNVPLTETVEYICQFVTENNIPLPFQTSTLKELILRCTLGIQFQF